jgi:carbonic anhydrase
VSITDELLDHNAAVGAGLGPWCPAAAAREAGRRGRLHGCPRQRRWDPGARGGDAHVVRDAGGVMSDDAIGLLLISRRLPGTGERPCSSPHRRRHADLRRGRGEGDVGVETGLTPPFAFEAFVDLTGRPSSVACNKRVRWGRTTAPSAASSARLPWAALWRCCTPGAGPSGRRPTPYYGST